MDFTYLSLSVHAFIHNYLHIIQREEQRVAVQTSVLSDEIKTEPLYTPLDIGMNVVFSVLM